MSGGGVTSGIDFALAVAAELRGPVAAQVAHLFIGLQPGTALPGWTPERRFA